LYKFLDLDPCIFFFFIVTSCVSPPPTTWRRLPPFCKSSSCFVCLSFLSLSPTIWSSIFPRFSGTVWQVFRFLIHNGPHLCRQVHYCSLRLFRDRYARTVPTISFTRLLGFIWCGFVQLFSILPIGGRFAVLREKCGDLLVVARLVFRDPGSLGPFCFPPFFQIYKKGGSRGGFGRALPEHLKFYFCGGYTPCGCLRISPVKDVPLVAFLIVSDVL